MGIGDPRDADMDLLPLKVSKNVHKDAFASAAPAVVSNSCCTLRAVRRLHPIPASILRVRSVCAGNMSTGKIRPYDRFVYIHVHQVLFLERNEHSCEVYPSSRAALANRLAIKLRL